MANSAAKMPKERICPTFEMMRCALIVAISAPMKKQELISPIAISLSPELFRMTPTELTISELPINKNDIPINRAFIDLIVRAVLDIFLPFFVIYSFRFYNFFAKILQDKILDSINLHYLRLF